MNAVIFKKKFLTPELEILWLKPTEKLDFQPGQYCTIGYEGIERPYSIVSAPFEENLELFVEIAPIKLRTAQSLTPKLCSLDIGETVTLRPMTKGRFLLDMQFSRHVMIATVTGIAPYISMIRAYVNGYYRQKVSEPLYVFHGASFQDEFGYDQELKRLSESTGKIVYVPTVSRPQEKKNKSWMGEIGRVHLILEPYFQKYNFRPEDTVIYLCGHPSMINILGNKKATAEKPLGTLLQKGFQVRTEAYF